VDIEDYTTVFLKSKRIFRIFCRMFFKHLNLMFSEKKTVDGKEFSRYNNKS